MHDAHAMQQVASIRLNIQVRYNIHPSNLIPPTHVFNGEFLFLGFLVGALISTGDINNRRACQSLKVIKHRNSISRYKSIAQSLLTQKSVAQMGFYSMNLGFYRWKYLMATYTSNFDNLGKITKPLHELSLVKKV